ncbi:cyclase family protein [Clostridium sp.]|uniref:cyclase family protein n=1 Tax=Clostridium sp. TaxID=1506 RepID=UPI003F2BFF28
MKVIDLSHKIEKNMSVFSKEEIPNIKVIANIKRHGFNEKSINMCSHTGTHIDSPNHILEAGNTLDKISVNDFIGKGFLLDLEEVSCKYISLMDLRKYEDSIKNCEYLIIKTGWSKYWKEKKYFSGFPVLTEEAAMWISSIKNIKGIGVDTISIDSVESDDLKIHKILLEKEKLIIENLKLIEEIPIEFTFVTLPLNYNDADGSPVRAVAICT